ncbi:WhiB family transcriptional regulator [Mycolicibacterium septicum]|uniref:WhiB family transcriptional regulator n=1 Tax=Mycolicibacterium septicum TaxID=98668 RepID=UPI00236054C9|nr:WhiB family transcriptional regulator [Mycolicibacterium septicum]
MIGELLRDLAHAVPDLPGAACRGQQAVMDVTSGRDHAAIAAAQHVCAGCRVRRECAAWLDSLPRSRRPSGVVAGIYVAPPKVWPLRDRPPRPPTKADRATRWLADYLRQHNPADSELVLAAATVAGFGKQPLQTARRRLGVTLERVTGRHGGHHIWTLPTTTGRNTTMTDHLPDDRLPDAPWFVPTEASVGRGYVAETGDDAITLTLLIPDHGPVNIALHPHLAAQIAAQMGAMCQRLAHLSTPTGEHRHD